MTMRPNESINDPGEILHLPDGMVIVSGYKVFMTPYLAVICPNGEVLVMNYEEQKLINAHLKSWALPIVWQVCDQ